MKTLLFILSFVCLFNFNSYSQSDCSCDDSQTELLAYVPMRTYHFDRTPSIAYHKTEGGNIGVVAVYRKTNDNKKIFYDTNIGVVRNSYNKVSILAQQGIGIKTKYFNVSANIGLVSGYKVLFVKSITETHTTNVNLGGDEFWEGVTQEITIENTKEINPSVISNHIPKVMQDLGIIPAVNLSISINTGRVSPMIVISPEYLNAGILVKI